MDPSKIVRDPRRLPSVNFDYAALRKDPDPEGGGAPAGDAADRLIVDLAAPSIRDSPPDSVVTVGDRYGALTLAALSSGAHGVRVCQDSITSQMALVRNANRQFWNEGRQLDDEGRPLDETLEYSVHAAAHASPGIDDRTDGLADSGLHFVELGPDAFRQARVVLLRLPRDLAVLTQWSRLIAGHAAPDVRVFAGGRIKHMTPSMNRVIGEAFEQVDVSLARQKARVLIASRPKTDRWATFGTDDSGSDGLDVDEVYDADLDLWVCSFPGVFAPGRVDIGTRFLVPYLADETNLRGTAPSLPTPAAADLGSGTGVLGAALLKAHPEYRLLAFDRSQAAVRSTRATLRKNLGDDGRFQVRLDHGLSTLADSSVDLVVCNPPFHSDAAVLEGMAIPLFRDAARVLRPGGVMLTVFNSHLPHRRALEVIVGPTQQLGRNPKFTITKSVKSQS